MRCTKQLRLSKILDKKYNIYSNLKDNNEQRIIILKQVKLKGNSNISIQSIDHYMVTPC